MPTDIDWKRWRTGAKERIDLREVIAQSREVTERTGSYIKVRCPFHKGGAEKTGSLSVQADRYKCFGCEAQGDIFDWLKSEAGGNLSEKDALQEVARRANLPLPEREHATGERIIPRSKPPAVLDLGKLQAEAERALRSDHDDPMVQKALELLEQRGLLGVADDLGFGVVTERVLSQLGGSARKFLGRLIIPTWWRGKVATLTARALLGQDKKYDRPGGEVPCPWHADALEAARAQGFVILVEGELDAAAMLVALGTDSPVMGLPGGNLPKAWADQLSGLTCYLLMDPDEAGGRHANKLKEALSGVGAKPLQIQLDPSRDVNECLVEYGPDGLADMLERSLEEAERPSDLRYIRATFLEELDARANRPHSAYSTGLESLDNLLGRGLVEGLHVLGGITGGGKTALSLQIATHNAKAGRPVLYVSYEQSKFELWARIASGLTTVPMMAFKTGKYLSYQDEVPTRQHLEMNKRQFLDQLEGISKHLRIVEGDAGVVTPGAARWTVPVIKTEAEILAEAYGVPPLVIIDYLQRMPVPEQFERRELRERVSMVATGLQVELARGLGCPVLVLSSVGRAAYAAGQGQQQDTPESLLRSFKEAGEVEFTAYTGTVLYRLPEGDAAARNLAPSKFSVSSQQWTPLALQVVKNREGDTGRILAKFYGVSGRVEDAGLDTDGKGK